MNSASYKSWLQYDAIKDVKKQDKLAEWCQNIALYDQSLQVKSAKEELVRGLTSIVGIKPQISNSVNHAIVLSTRETLPKEAIHIEAQRLEDLNDEGFIIESDLQTKSVYLVGNSPTGVLYAVFRFLRDIQRDQEIHSFNVIDRPRNQIRMMNQWDNMDGSIERGYAGQSIFYKDNEFRKDLERVKDYARLLASVGINAISINNVNVFEVETHLITKRFLPDVAEVADVFRAYGIKTFLSINYASPIQIGNLATADPLDEQVKAWWKAKAQEIYDFIPDFGGFVVKADSEHRPGPFSYGRDHADGSNMLAEALEPFNGIVIWRCFVYNCLQDWRDRKTDRARAAYDHFKKLDGQFRENVVLQIKNGPMDFQVREPVSPLFGAMEQTNQVLEFQVTQEYTGQQKDLCYLVPLWKEVLDFNTFANGGNASVKSIIDGSLYDNKYSGIAAVSNIGDDENWTGHTLAQANLYGYGRLIWDPELSSEQIADEWIRLTFGEDRQVNDSVYPMLLHSWSIYENYTAPLGIGWMVNPNHHYGPNIDGYEYSVWGTYHFADWQGIGVDRTVKSGTGYAGQYFSPNAKMYESIESCPDELILFFHHVPYTHRLKSGETVIQHIYNTHFKGVEQVEELISTWEKVKGRIDGERYHNVRERLDMQLSNAKEWRDMVNTYFYRKSGITDEKKRTIY
ncbi:alpha-glucuronidase family glycosyl hydrolase [Halalkalibacter hemicellulosilyticus]|uniref:Xylan alpha-1,2-glucuronidase n=1 Tax=Halalkalibacter hemicellulosilyticusJCM 9152 TaxID=1236971 RepID=W4QCG5_9BACI|nr:alpha-glucuronidase family glycosyl hydrolase [Halalkalibacter hemicellulosilyticus]GAE29725.1 alpha-glucosidase [Halalkalibacter hemicellulosilyticusJCM 9152]